MTTNSILNSLQRLEPFFVGFDKLWEDIDLAAKSVDVVGFVPPYNIRKTGNDKYVIEMAVAGFGRSDVNIEMRDGSLFISGESTSDDKNTMVYQGIANRAFKRQFNLADTVVVKNAELINGMLRVFLEKIVPENKQVRNIDITEPSKKELLAEGKR